MPQPQIVVGQPSDHLAPVEAGDSLKHPSIAAARGPDLGLGRVQAACRSAPIAFEQAVAPRASAIDGEAGAKQSRTVEAGLDPRGDLGQSANGVVRFRKCVSHTHYA